MATPEGKVKGWLDKMLRDEGVFFFSPQAGPYGSAGVHDRIAIVCGLFVGIECKADASRKMTALQERFWNKVEEAGGKCFLVYDKATIELVRKFIHNVRACNPRQESGSGSVPQPGRTTGYYTYSEISPDQFSYYSPSLGRMFSLTEPRAPST